MCRLFETVLTLSVFGFCMIAMLLLLKPITLKRFPAKWQYCVWIMVLFIMVVPVYKFIPKRHTPILSFSTQLSQTAKINDTLAEEPGFALKTTDTENKLYFKNILPFLWLAGVCIYSCIVLFSYSIYLLRKRKTAVVVTENALFESVKAKLNIKRKIKLKVARDIQSPVLAGIFFPTVYLPTQSLNHEMMYMIFLHELTHYKQKDLVVKWVALAVHIIHWFNPLSYVLCKNISEACEIVCDMQVTSRMSDSEQKLYMKTVLDLAEQEVKSKC